MQQAFHFNYRKVVVNICLWGISLVCLAYALSNVAFKQMWAAVNQYTLLSILLIVLLELGVCFINGFRKYILFDSCLPLSKAIQSAFLGLGGNNIFPAKAGEIIHVLYISKVTGIPKTEVFPIVFLERFADINVLAIVSFCMLSVLEPSWWLICLVSMFIFGIWLGMLIVYKKPSWIFYILQYIPWEYPRKIGEFVCEALHSKLTFSWMLRLIFTTLAVWIVTISFYVTAFIIVAELPLSIIDSISASFILCLGAILPSSPGSIGVFEASTVFALGLFDIEHSTSLAIGLLCHAVVFFIPVIGMFLSMYYNKQVKTLVLTTERELK